MTSIHIQFKFATLHKVLLNFYWDSTVNHKAEWMGVEDHTEDCYGQLSHGYLQSKTWRHN